MLGALLAGAAIGNSFFLTDTAFEIIEKILKTLKKYMIVDEN
jgi:hypothetical protein